MSGEVPKEWRSTRLGDVSRSFAGGTPSRSNPAYYGPGIPWLKSGEVRAGRISMVEEQITEIGLQESSARIAKAGSPVIAMYGATAGVAGILEVDAALNQAVLAIEPVGTKLDNEFCFHLLSAEAPRLLTMTQGSGQPNLSKGLIDGLSVPLPPLDEQRRIAEVLRSVDNAMAGGQNVAEQAQTVWNGLTETLIWDRLSSSPNVAQPLGHALLGTDYGVNAPLGNEPTGYAVLRMGNLQDGWIDPTDMKWGEIADAEALTLALDVGDILFNRTNSRDLVGKVALVREPTDFLYASYIVRLRVDQSVADPYYLFAMMHSRRAQAQFKSIATPGVSQSNINPTNLKKQIIPLPPLADQRGISEQLQSAEAARRIALEQLVTLRQIKSDLMSDLLSGRVRVPA
ncbi:restriction endonuclease subunit S [Mesorhizobium sp. VK24D]|uniref:Restriction endonuclease subunit S n=1 Tax=Mesorhizobium album TaxID=3072314 RepID=A0ABU4XQK1_9HYPH|nr:restriction endonuclease subunit S [Mesorhizobium sp. VK24D]MDX8477014.1 restriction endonuclease subunit S [Mesorhizobium sp. VK24D]